MRSTETTRLLPASPGGTAAPVHEEEDKDKDKDKDRKFVVYACLMVGFAVVALLFVWISTHSYDHFHSLYLDTQGEKGGRVHLQAVEEGVYLRIDSSDEGQGSVIATESIPWASGSSLTVVLGAHDCWYMKSTWSGKWLVITEKSVSGVTKKRLHTHSNDDIRHATCFEAVTMPKNDFSSVRNTLQSGEHIFSFRVANTDEWLTLSLTSVSDASLSSKKPHYFVTTTTTIEDISVFRMQDVELLKGVNLGGWFIPEVWMRPSFFKDTGLGWGGSLCAMRKYNETLAEERIQESLSTWITEQDFQEIKALGFNSIRVPVGYWNVIKDPYGMFVPRNHNDSLYYVDWCFDMADRYNLTLLLDIHGAPGSQNGMDHSGCNMSPEWTSDSNIRLTLQAVEAMATRYSYRKSLLGFELLNEPSQAIEASHHDILAKYYKAGYDIIRKHSDTALVVLNELYRPYYKAWQHFSQEPDYYNVVMDYHLYDWQEPYTAESPKRHVHDTLRWTEDLKKYAPDHPILVGEWSMSTGTVVQVGQVFVDACIKSFAHSMGHYAWNWKIEEGIGFDEWSVRYQAFQPSHSPRSLLVSSPSLLLSSSAASLTVPSPPSDLHVMKMKPDTLLLDPKQSSRYLVELEPDTRYHQITFGGCGFLLAYHFGAILCMFDNGISTDNAVGISGGAMAALAMLRGSDIYVGLRQGIVDLVNEGCGLILLGLNMLFMNYYFKYMWNFRCLHISHTDAKRLSVSTQSCDFPLHDMSPSHRRKTKELNGCYHVQMVSIAAQDPTGNALDPLAQRVAGSYLDDSFWHLSAIHGSFGRALQSMLVPVVIEEYADDAAIVQAACLSGGIPGITTFWPRYFDEHFCCLDRMTSAPININRSTADLTTFMNSSSDTAIPTTTSSPPKRHEGDPQQQHQQQQQQRIKPPGRVSSWQTMTETELHEAVKEAAEVHNHTIVISPIRHDFSVFRGSDIGLCGGYINPFPVFPWQLNARKQTFIAGYRDMQRRIRNPKLLDPSRSIEVTETVMRSCASHNADDNGNNGECDENGSLKSMTITKTVDAEETIAELIDFILYDSYAKDWKSPHFSMRIDGKFTSSHTAPQNCALTRKEMAIAGTCFCLFVGAMFWHPFYFIMGVAGVLAVGAAWIFSYLLGVDRINREVERKHEEETHKDNNKRGVSGFGDSSGGSEVEDVDMGNFFDIDAENKDEDEGKDEATSRLTHKEYSTIPSTSDSNHSYVAASGSSLVSSALPSTFCSQRVLRSATKKKNM